MIYSSRSRLRLYIWRSLVCHPDYNYKHHACLFMLLSVADCALLNKQRIMITSVTMTLMSSHHSEIDKSIVTMPEGEAVNE